MKILKLSSLLLKEFLESQVLNYMNSQKKQTHLWKSESNSFRKTFAKKTMKVL